MKAQSGQAILEYVLLLLVAVAIATVITTQLVKRDYGDPSNSGSLIIKWRQIQNSIGQDPSN